MAAEHKAKIAELYAGLVAEQGKHEAANVGAAAAKLAAQEAADTAADTLAEARRQIELLQVCARAVSLLQPSLLAHQHSI
eukprot:SAG22_NODE_155_length_17123_cov_37.528489_4_plen_80_part_00